MIVIDTNCKFLPRLSLTESFLYSEILNGEGAGLIQSNVKLQEWKTSPAQTNFNVSWRGSFTQFGANPYSTTFLKQVGQSWLAPIKNPVDIGQPYDKPFTYSAASGSKTLSSTFALLAGLYSVTGRGRATITANSTIGKVTHVPSLWGSMNVSKKDWYRPAEVTTTLKGENIRAANHQLWHSPANLWPAVALAGETSNGKVFAPQALQEYRRINMPIERSTVGVNSQQFSYISNWHILLSQKVTGIITYMSGGGGSTNNGTTFDAGHATFDGGQCSEGYETFKSFSRFSGLSYKSRWGVTITMPGFTTQVFSSTNETYQIGYPPTRTVYSYSGSSPPEFAAPPAVGRCWVGGPDIVKGFVTKEEDTMSYYMPSYQGMLADRGLGRKVYVDARRISNAKEVYANAADGALTGLSKSIAEMPAFLSDRIEFHLLHAAGVYGPNVHTWTKTFAVNADLPEPFKHTTTTKQGFATTTTYRTTAASWWISASQGRSLPEYQPAWSIALNNKVTTTSKKLEIFGTGKFTTTVGAHVQPYEFSGVGNTAILGPLYSSDGFENVTVSYALAPEKTTSPAALMVAGVWGNASNHKYDSKRSTVFVANNKESVLSAGDLFSFMVDVSLWQGKTTTVAVSPGMPIFPAPFVSNPKEQPVYTPNFPIPHLICADLVPPWGTFDKHLNWPKTFA